MEYMTPNFTKDMVKTHKILIPNMAVTQFRLMQAALPARGTRPRCWATAAARWRSWA